MPPQQHRRRTRAVATYWLLVHRNPALLSTALPKVLLSPPKSSPQRQACKLPESVDDPQELPVMPSMAVLLGFAVECFLGRVLDQQR